MKDMDLKIFLTLIEVQSFTLAGKSLGIAQPRVSEAMARLEKELGQSIIKRGSHVAQPTFSGKKLADYAKKILDLKEAAIEEIAGLQEKKTVPLQLAASSVPGNYILPAMISQFCRKNPNTRPKMILSNSSQVCTQVLEGKAEIGIVGAKASLSGLKWQTWRKDRLVLIVDKNHRWKDRDSISLKELVGEPLLLREDSSGTRKTILLRFKALKIAKSSLNVVAELGGAEALKRAVCLQMGVSIVSFASVEEEVKVGKIMAKEIDHMQPERDLFIVTAKSKKLSPIAESFHRFLEDCNP